MAADKNQGKNVLNVPTLRFPEFSGEWEKYRLGDIMEFTKERISTSLLTEDNYVSTENMLQDFQGVACAHNVPENTNVMEYKQGDVLVSNIRPYLKKVWMADKDGGCSADVFVMRANRNVCTDDFLHHIVANDRFVGYVMSGAKGVKMPRGDKEQMKDYETALPSLIEQQKVAHLLAIIDERISTQIRIIQELKMFRDTLMFKLLSPRKNWEHVCIHDIAMVVGGGTPDTNVKEYWDGNIQWFTPSEIGKEKYAIVSEKTISQAGLDNSSAKLLPANTILLSTRATIGECSIAKKECCTNQGFQSLIATKVTPEFLYYLIQTKKRDLLSKASGSTFSEISANEVRKIHICIPTTAKEQEALVQPLSAYDEKIETECKILYLYKLQKQFLLSKLFI